MFSLTQFNAQDVKQELEDDFQNFPIPQFSSQTTKKTLKIPEKDPIKYSLSLKDFKKTAGRYRTRSLNSKTEKLVLRLIDMEEGAWDSVAYSLYQRTGVFVAENHVQSVFRDKWLRKQRLAERAGGPSDATQAATGAPLDGPMEAGSSSLTVAQLPLSMPHSSPTPQPSTSISQSSTLNSTLPNIDYAFFASRFDKFNADPAKKELAINGLLKMLVEVEEGSATTTKQLFENLAK